MRAMEGNRGRASRCREPGVTGGRRSRGAEAAARDERREPERSVTGGEDGDGLQANSVTEGEANERVEQGGQQERSEDSVTGGRRSRGAEVWKLCALLLGLFVAACDRSESDATQDFTVGVCHVRSFENAEIAAEAGATSIRNTISWRALDPAGSGVVVPKAQQERQKDARRLGLKLLTPIAYSHPLYDGGGYPVSEKSVTAYAQASAFAAAALRHPQPVFEIWNEWNLGIGMPAEAGKGAPRDYVRLLSAAYDVMKKKPHPPTVLGGVMAGAGLTDDWLEQACEAGMLRHLDGLSFHPYCYWMEGLKVLPEQGMLWLIRSLEEIVDRYPGGARVPLYLTEIGWPTYEGDGGVSLDEQAQFAARTLLLARANRRIRGVWWFNLRDRDSSSDRMNDRFGLLFSDGTPKPAFFAFRDTARLLGNVVDARHERLGGTVHAMRLTLRDGRHAIACWVARPNVQARIEVATTKPGIASVQLIGSGMERRAEESKGRIVVSVGNMPVVLFGVDEDAALQPTVVGR